MDDLNQQVDYNDDEARMYDDVNLMLEAFDYKDLMMHLNSQVHDDSKYRTNINMILIKFPVFISSLLVVVVEVDFDV
jgi:hypothetical protein